MKEEFHFYDKQMVIKSNRGICQDSEELIKSNLFKRMLEKFLKYLKKKDSPLLGIFKTIPNSTQEEILVSCFLLLCKDLNFRELHQLREILKSIILNYSRKKFPDLFSSLIELILNIYPPLKQYDLTKLKKKEIVKTLDNLFLMKRYNFTEISKKREITIKDFTNEIKKSHLKDEELFFYTKNRKSNIIYFYELEREKLINFFERNKKISNEEISNTFSQVMESTKDLKSFIKILIKLEQINGYYSKLGFFYPFIHIKSVILNNFQKNGLVNLKNYDYLPQNFIQKIIDKISQETKQIFLMGKNRQFYYSLKKIQQQINSEAARNSSIDLKPFRERLKDEDFIILIKNLPREYLTNLRKGTHWLTNIGKTKIKKEIDNSKIIGFCNLTRISEKLNIKNILLMDVLEQYIDLRGGIWDIEKEVFYYSMYLKDQIENINQIADEEERKIKINLLAAELNIDKNIILTKIDENLKEIFLQIKSQDIH